MLQLGWMPYEHREKPTGGTRWVEVCQFWEPLRGGCEARAEEAEGLGGGGGGGGGGVGVGWGWGLNEDLYGIHGFSCIYGANFAITEKWWQ